MSCVNTTNNKLYYNLSNLCDTEAQARELYAKIMNPEFIKDYKLKLDKNGIPSFRDVYRKAKLNRHLKDEKQIKYLETILQPRTLKSTPENIDMLGNEVTIFNSQNEMSDFVAVIDAEDGTVTSKIVKRNYNTDLQSRKIKTNTDLNNYLKSKLAEIGVSVGAITELERRRGIAGVTEFDRAKDAATGIVELIRISNDEKGAEALPEEFSHFALEAMGENNQLVNRLYNIIDDEIIMMELADQYYDYYDRYNGDETALKKEVAGKLLAEYIKAEYTGQSGNLMERVFNAIKDKFSQLDEMEIRKKVIDLDATLTQASKEILHTDLLKELGLRNIQPSNSLFNLNPKEMDMSDIDSLLMGGLPPVQEDNTERKGSGIEDAIASMGLSEDFGFGKSSETEPIEVPNINMDDYQVPEMPEIGEIPEIPDGVFDPVDFSAMDALFAEANTGNIDIGNTFSDLIDTNNSIKSNLIDIKELKKSFDEDVKNLIDDLNTEGELNKITKMFINIESSLSKLNNLNRSKGYTDDRFANKEAIERYVYKTKNMLGNLLNFVYNSIDNLNKAWDMYDSHSGSRNINSRCNYLLVFSNTVKALDYVLNTTDTQNLYNVIATEFSSESDRKIKAVLNKYITSLSHNINLAKQFIKGEEVVLAKSFLSEKFGDTFEIPMTLSKDQVLTLDDELTGKNIKDVGYTTRFMSSLGNSPSMILKMVDQIVKSSNDNRRNKMFETKRKIIALGREYVNATGSDDFGFMYAKDSDGKRTGYYVGEMDYAEYDKYYEEMVLSRKDEYIIDGEFDKEAFKPIIREFEAFMKSRNYFHSSEYDRLNDAQKDFLGKYIALKTDLDRQMFYEQTITGEPDDIFSQFGIDFGNNLLNKEKFKDEKRAHKTIKIEKSLINKLKSSDSLKEGIEQIKRALKETVTKTSSDTDLIDDKNKAYMTNFEGDRVYDIPALFTTMQEDESEENMTTDPISSLIAYGDAAENRYEKMQIISIIDVLKEVVNQREVMPSGEEIAFQKLKTHFGEFEIPPTIKGKNSNISKMLDDYLESQVYGMWNVDLGNFNGTNISKSKMVDLALSQTALTGMALNVLGGISNVATGNSMMRIESICGQFFDIKDVAKADIEYAKNIGNVILDAGELVKNNKMSVFIEQFNILQEYEQEIAHTEFDTNNFMRCCSEQGLFILNNLGEHYLQTRTALSVAYSTKVKDKDGNEIPLWEAMELRDIDPEHPEYGKKIFLKEGVTDTNGNAIEDVTEYFNKFARRVTAINQRMHGIYNYEDRCAAQRYAIGRLFYQFRKYIPVSIQRRFGSAQYNFDLDSPTEGYYITAGKFMKKLYTELKQRRASIASVWDSMNKWERQNCIRASVEMAQTLIIYASFNALEYAMGDKKKDNPWAAKMLDYQLRRLYNELGAMTPSLGMLSESLKIIESPFAACRILDKDIEFLEILNPWNWTDDAIIKQGKYKGHTKGAKAALQILPVYSAMINTFDPYEATKFFKN